MAQLKCPHFNKENPRILVVKNRAMGDSLIGLSSLQYIREIYPEATLFYGLPSWIIPLYENFQNRYFTCVDVDLNSWKSYKKLWQFLKEEDIDLVLELNQKRRTARFLKATTFLLGIPYIFHNHHKKKGKVIDQGLRKPAIQRDLDGCWSLLGLTKENGMPIARPSFEHYVPYFPVSSQEDDLRETPIKKSLPKIILGVSASKKTKMWPLVYFHILIEKLKEQLKDVEFIVPLSRSLFDIKIAEEMKKIGLMEKVTLVQSSLDELPQILVGSRFFIGNDSGLKHLAVSLRIPTLTFFGPEEPLEWHPYSEQGHPYLYIPGLECRTRKSHFCALKECDNRICLDNIAPEMAFKKVSDRLQMMNI